MGTPRQLHGRDERQASPPLAPPTQAHRRSCSIAVAVAGDLLDELRYAPRRPVAPAPFRELAADVRMSSIEVLRSRKRPVPEGWWPTRLPRPTCRALACAHRRPDRSRYSLLQMGFLDKLLGRDKRQPSPPPPAPTPDASPQLASIAVADPSSLPAGAVGVVGATVNLTAPVSVDTALQAMSTNPAALTVESAVVPTGQSSAPLLVSVFEGGASAQVSVTLGAQTLQATIVTG